MPKWLKFILDIIPMILRYFRPQKSKLPEPIEMTDSVWDERRKKTDD